MSNWIYHGEELREIKQLEAERKVVSKKLAAARKERQDGLIMPDDGEEKVESLKHDLLGIMFKLNHRNSRCSDLDGSEGDLEDAHLWIEGLC